VDGDSRTTRRDILVDNYRSLPTVCCNFTTIRSGLADLLPLNIALILILMHNRQAKPAQLGNSITIQWSGVMSRKTTLCIANYSGKNIISMAAKVEDMDGFEDPAGFKNWLQTNGSGLRENDSLCGYVEISNGGPSRYSLALNFDDATSLSFTDDLQQASVKHVGPIDPTRPLSGMQVWRTSGGDVGNSTHGTNAISIRALPKPDNSNWMRDLLRTRPHLALNQLTMPGSHDAGLYKVTYPLDLTTENHPEWVLTQNLSVAEQLVSGARYFDLRIRNDQGTLCAAHWTTVLGKSYGALGAPLNDVLNDVVWFLQNTGRSEVVVLKFSHGSDTVLCGKVVQRVKDIVGGASLLYNPAGVAINVATAHLQNASLNQMAGKVVAVFGGDGAGYDSYWKPKEGIFPYFDMPLENASDADVKTPISRLYVYDHYADKGSYEEMVADQSGKLAAYGGTDKKYLFLLSWTLSGGGAVSDIEVLAGMANPWLPKKLSALTEEVGTADARMPNIVFIDFIDPYVCSAIIELNHRAVIRSYSYATGPGVGTYLGEQPPNGGWQFGKPLFYAFTYDAPGAIPIYRFQAKDPARYYYTRSMDDGRSFGQFDGIAFYAFYSNPPPGTIPINQFQRDENGLRIYECSSDTKASDGWVLSGVNFYAYPYGR
jgi:hypothetical protein